MLVLIIKQLKLYIMGQIIKTISVSKAEDEFLINNNISPTRLIRNKVQEMMEFKGSSAEVKDLQNRIQRIMQNLQKHADFIAKKGLTDEFLETKE